VKISDFDYALPPELIAQRPVEPRDSARLLVVDRSTGKLHHRHFRDLPEYLHPGDLLVGNNSRVIPARLHGRKPTGGEVEIFLLRPAAGGGTDNSPWECLVRGKGLRRGARVEVTGSALQSIRATVLEETLSGGRLVAFEPPVREWLWVAGEVPLPPYIHQALNDPERYQTIYSRVEGSVASSTAGLHFTPELLLALREGGIDLAFVTLHIGLDTFRPVQVENVEDHHIHREWAELSPVTARKVNEARLRGGRIFAIGTTSVRVLESAAKVALGFRPGDDVPPEEVCGWQTVAAFEGETDLFIRPGHAFRAVDVLITNFHLPRSTLLLLVSAFAGKALIDRAYAEAMQERYRFYSFGDAMLIL
jgi:S-adenosylmethionine:tRNA ribosyltransferase-isomerase